MPSSQIMRTLSDPQMIMLSAGSLQHQASATSIQSQETAAQIALLMSQQHPQQQQQHVQQQQQQHTQSMVFAQLLSMLHPVNGAATAAAATAAAAAPAAAAAAEAALASEAGMAELMAQAGDILRASGITDPNLVEALTARLRTRMLLQRHPAPDAATPAPLAPLRVRPVAAAAAAAAVPARSGEPQQQQDQAMEDAGSPDSSTATTSLCPGDEEEAAEQLLALADPNLGSSGGGSGDSPTASGNASEGLGIGASMGPPTSPPGPSSRATAPIGQLKRSRTLQPSQPQVFKRRAYARNKLVPNPKGGLLLQPQRSLSISQHSQQPAASRQQGSHFLASPAAAGKLPRLPTLEAQASTAASRAAAVAATLVKPTPAPAAASAPSPAQQPLLPPACSITKPPTPANAAADAAAPASSALALRAQPSLSAQLQLPHPGLPLQLQQAAPSVDLPQAAAAGKLLHGAAAGQLPRTDGTLGSGSSVLTVAELQLAATGGTLGSSNMFSAVAEVLGVSGPLPPPALAPHAAVTAAAPAPLSPAATVAAAASAAAASAAAAALPLPLALPLSLPALLQPLPPPTPAQQQQQQHPVSISTAHAALMRACKARLALQTLLEDDRDFASSQGVPFLPAGVAASLSHAALLLDSRLLELVGGPLGNPLMPLTCPSSGVGRGGAAAAAAVAAHMHAGRVQTA